MTMNFTGKTALVTGGGRGFGEAMGRALAREGMKVVVADLDLAEAKRVAGEISSTGGEAMPIQTDISDESKVDSMVKNAVSRYGGIDVLLNNAGLLGFMGPLEKTPTDAWDRAFAVNVRGHFFVTRAVLPHMIAQRSGHIVNTTSNLARIGYRKGRPCTAYATTKFAMEGVTWALSVEVEPHNIRVNAIAPAVAPTHFFNAQERAGLKDREVWKPDHTVGPLMFLLKSDVTGTSIDAWEWHEQHGSKNQFCYKFGAN